MNLLIYIIKLCENYITKKSKQCIFYQNIIIYVYAFLNIHLLITRNIYECVAIILNA